MDKSFGPQDFETRIYQSWEALGYFAASGTLHMGHAFQQTLMVRTTHASLLKRSWKISQHPTL
jgi:hypothetical protein